MDREREREGWRDTYERWKDIERGGREGDMVEWISQPVIDRRRQGSLRLAHSISYVNKEC